MDKWSRNKGKRADGLPDPATDSMPKPGDYPLGSLESRAAARALVGSKQEAETVIQIVYVSPDGTKEDGPRIRLPRI